MVLLFVLLGALGCFEPLINGSDLGALPFWLKLLLILFSILSLFLFGNTLRYKLILNEKSLIHKGKKSWSIKWDEVDSWCSVACDVGDTYLKLIYLKPKTGEGLLKIDGLLLTSNSQFKNVFLKIKDKCGSPLSKSEVMSGDIWHKDFTPGDKL
jgi:hypothetical protein